MDDSSTLMVTGGSSIDGNYAFDVSSPTFLPLGSWFVRQVINRKSFAAKERLRDDRARRKRCAHPRVHSQEGGGAYVHTYSKLTVTDGSSIDGNTAATVSSLAFALASGLLYWFVKQSIDACSMRKRDFERDDRARRNRCARPRVRSQYGGGAYVHSSTLTVTDGSSIDGNTANVLPAFALASGLVVASPSNRLLLDRCERETQR